MLKIVLSYSLTHLEIYRPVIRIISFILAPFYVKNNKADKLMPVCFDYFTQTLLLHTFHGHSSIFSVFSKSHSLKSDFFKIRCPEYFLKLSEYHFFPINQYSHITVSGLDIGCKVYQIYFLLFLPMTFYDF